MSGKYLSCCLLIIISMLLILFTTCTTDVFRRTADEVEERRPAKAPLITPWGKKVSPENVWREYPRPQMVRKDWLNLNGLWKYAITEAVAYRPNTFEENILVPFCIQSPLSGVQRNVTSGQRLWYRRLFDLPESWRDRRVLLHFGAVDWETTVWVNNQQIGIHRGGYDPFTMDITGALKPGEEQEIILKVWDPGESGLQPIGKQTVRRQTSQTYELTTGIWQTVWLEPVANVSIKRLNIIPDIDNQMVKVAAEIHGDAAGCQLEMKALDGNEIVGREVGDPKKPISLVITKPKLWSPDSPFLYTLKATLLRDGKTLDMVDSYFGMRKISLGKDEQGINRIFLNNEQIFQIGPLDQGYWPDGVFTPPSEAAMRFDLEYLKSVACNMVRLHIKVNPARWYYHCDRLGLLVWQDFVCGLSRGKNLPPEAVTQWDLEHKRIIDALYNHPSIIMWIVFNEGWGQHETERITHWAMEYDSSRLVSNASGWIDVMGLANIRDIHDYTTYPSIPIPGREKTRAVVLGECGGFNVIVKDHNWHSQIPQERSEHDNEWIYDIKRPTYSIGERLTEHYAALVENLRLLQMEGLCAAVYTQIVDMKREQNGYLSFDRQVSKMDPKNLLNLHERLFLPSPQVSPIIIPSLEQPQQWRYSISEKSSDWFAQGFEDKNWSEGFGPFGNTDGDPQRVRTRWTTSDLYLRKSFNLNEVPQRAVLKIYCFGQIYPEINDCEIYLNGKLTKVTRSRHIQQEFRVTDILLDSDTLNSLKQGTNLIAVRCEMNEINPRLIDFGFFKVTD